jgi:hypothetical protein
MSKLILSESQMVRLSKTLKEQESDEGFKISYEPEKIDEFVKDAENVLSSTEKVLNLSIQKILSINMQELIQSPDEMKQLLDYLENFHKNVDKKFGKFYDIVEMYEIGEYPDNIRQLDALASKIDNKNLDIYYLKDALRNILDVRDDISKLV